MAVLVVLALLTTAAMVLTGFAVALVLITRDERDAFKNLQKLTEAALDAMRKARDSALQELGREQREHAFWPKACYRREDQMRDVAEYLRREGGVSSHAAERLSDKIARMTFEPRDADNPTTLEGEP